MIDRVREALSLTTLNRRMRELLAEDLKNPAIVARLRTAYETALERGAVRHWRELYPEA